MRAGYQPSSRHPRVEEPSYHHATPMDIEPNEDNTILSNKVETIDYSHGSGTVGSSAIQSVDYHHGEPMTSNFGNPVPSLSTPVPPPNVPGPAAYGGDPATYAGFPAYANYEGYESYPPGGVSGMSYSGQAPATGTYFSGLDPAAIFAAYNEQTGMCNEWCCLTVMICCCW